MIMVHGKRLLKRSVWTQARQEQLVFSQFRWPVCWNKWERERSEKERESAAINRNSSTHCSYTSDLVLLWYLWSLWKAFYFCLWIIAQNNVNLKYTYLSLAAMHTNVSFYFCTVWSRMISGIYTLKKLVFLRSYSEDVMMILSCVRALAQVFLKVKL